MRHIVFIIFASILFTSCDTSGLERERVSPAVDIRFVVPDGLADPQKSTNEKLGPWQITLLVVSDSGVDYSPTANTQVISDSESARFTVQIFPDSMYTFSAVYSRDGQIWAEGSTRYEVQKSTRLIPLDIILRPGVNNASIGFKPAIVVRSPSADRVPLVLYFHGLEKPVKALACKMNVTGINTNRLSFTNADLSIAQNGRIDLAWSWLEGRSGSFVVDTLLVPVDQISDIIMSFSDGNLQVLEETTPRPLTATGARLTIVSPTDL